MVRGVPLLRGSSGHRHDHGRGRRGPEHVDDRHWHTPISPELTGLSSRQRAALAAEWTRDPAVCAVLARIAADELRHAEIAWSFLAWALARGSAPVHAACVAALAAAEAALCAPRQHVSEDISVPLLTHGRLDAERHAAVTRRAMTNIIGPAARRLLAQHAPRLAA